MNSQADETRELAVDFVQTCSREERMLLILKHELYEGNWSEMVADLRARLAGKPYIFRLAHRIEDDLERIGRLRGFEETYAVDLSNYVSLET